MTVYLARKGYHYSPATIHKYMNAELGLRSIVRPQKTDYEQGKPHKVFENKLQQNFMSDKINQKWCTDFTYLFLKNHDVRYNCSIIDLHDRSVIASITDRHITSDLAIRTLQKALDSQPAIKGELILHSDQGSQYTSKAFTDFCKSVNVTQSMSKAGYPYDNAPMERYFNTLKNECTNLYEFKTEEELYRDYGTVGQMESLLNEILFSKWLVTNYFTPVDELQISGETARNLIWSRDAIFAWLYKNETQNIAGILSKVSVNMIKDSIKNGYISKAVKQFNLKCSLEEYFSGGEPMSTDYESIRKELRRKIQSKETEQITSDEEYYYAVGQLVNYFISLSKAKDKKHSLANPFFNIKNNQALKDKLRQYFIKYNYQLNCSGTWFNNLYAMICNYTKAEKTDQNSMIAGYINNNILYQKKNMEEQVNE